MSVPASSSAVAARSSFFVGVLLLIAASALGQPLPNAHDLLVEKMAQGDYSRRGADTCLGCHDEEEAFPTAALFDTIHGHPGVAGSPFATGSPTAYPASLQCEACHGPVGEHGRQTLRPDAVREAMINFGQRGNAGADLQNQLCLACHADYNRAQWAGSAHEQADVACAACHLVHSPTDPVRTRAGQASRCLDCHRTVAAELLERSSHPMGEHQLACRDCHDPHGGEGLLRRASPNEACFDCHAEKRGPFLWEHPPAAEDCRICHQPHGANQPALLVRRPPQLCQACHSSVGHRSLSQVASQQPSDAQAEFLFAKACLNCHAEVHGSNHPSGNLLRR